MNMLTEFGVYEVLSQSRKPLAKEFKKWSSTFLKEIRLNGYYMDGELVEEPDHYKAPDTLAEAERYYIDTLAKAIAEGSKYGREEPSDKQVNPIHAGGRTTMELVYMDGKKEPYTLSSIVAECTGLQHHTITKTIRKHQAKFEQFRKGWI